MRGNPFRAALVMVKRGTWDEDMIGGLVTMNMHNFGRSGAGGCQIYYNYYCCYYYYLCVYMLSCVLKTWLSRDEQLPRYLFMGTLCIAMGKWHTLSRLPPIHLTVCNESIESNIEMSSETLQVMHSNWNWPRIPYVHPLLLLECTY